MSPLVKALLKRLAGNLDSDSLPALPPETVAERLADRLIDRTLVSDHVEALAAYKLVQELTDLPDEECLPPPVLTRFKVGDRVRHVAGTNVLVVKESVPPTATADWLTLCECEGAIDPNFDRRHPLRMLVAVEEEPEDA